MVEHALQGEDTSISIVNFIAADVRLADRPITEIAAMLLSVGFSEEKQADPVASLSGGWKMKLELARAMLIGADILLLDEPTNHLDVQTVAWLEQYLCNLPDITCMIVSHDSGFLDNVCTDIVSHDLHIAIELMTRCTTSPRSSPTTTETCPSLLNESLPLGHTTSFPPLRSNSLSHLQDP